MDDFYYQKSEYFLLTALRSYLPLQNKVVGFPFIQ